MKYPVKEGLSRDVVKKEIFAISHPLVWLSSKLRVEVEFKDGYYINADALVVKIKTFLQKLEFINRRC